MTYQDFLDEYRGSCITYDEAIAFLNEHGIDFPRLRNAFPMNDETPYTDDEIVQNLNDYLDYKAAIDTPVGKKERKFSDLHGKKRKEVKRYRNQIRKRLIAFASIWEKHCGKNVLCVRSRQGGNNRGYYPIDTNHPRYMEDVDDWFDDTYCYAFYDFKEETI